MQAKGRAYMSLRLKTRFVCRTKDFVPEGFPCTRMQQTSNKLKRVDLSLK